MTAQEVIDILREGIYVLLLVAAPAMLVSLSVGLMISLFQALTQIQEMTLTFVPKMIAMLLTLIAAMPFMLEKLTNYTNELSNKMVEAGTRDE